MPDLLLELFSEEIPARMQAGAARDLERLMVGADRSRLSVRGYQGLCRTAAAAPGDHGTARQAEGCARGAEGAQDRCARSGAGGLPEKDRPDQRTTQSRENAQGRCLYRGDRAGGPRAAACAGRVLFCCVGFVALVFFFVLVVGLLRVLGSAASLC